MLRLNIFRHSSKNLKAPLLEFFLAGPKLRLPWFVPEASSGLMLNNYGVRVGVLTWFHEVGQRIKELLLIARSFLNRSEIHKRF